MIEPTHTPQMSANVFRLLRVALELHQPWALIHDDHEGTMLTAFNGGAQVVCRDGLTLECHRFGQPVRANVHHDAAAAFLQIEHSGGAE